MVDMKKAFGVETKDVSQLFGENNVGFYIPLYQREYSWDDENIEQLMEDISRGVQSLVESGNKDQALRFLGTIIRIAERNKNEIQPQDSAALPARIEKIIDGQQRISTIALFGCVLYQKMYAYETQLNRRQIKGLSENLLDCL